VDPTAPMDPLISLRRELREGQERSNEKRRTAGRIRDFLATGVRVLEAAARKAAGGIEGLVSR